MAENEEIAQAEKPRSGAWIAVAVVAFALAIVAWVAMLYNEHVSFWCGAVGAVASLAAAIWGRRGFWRDVAITSAIACLVLLIVYAVFYWAILYAINKI